MTKIVSPEEFDSAFRAVMTRRVDEIAAAWSDSPAFTELCLSRNGSLLANVSEILGLKYFKEYWGMDAVMCERVDEDNFQEDWWAEQLTVVIEHENQIARAHDEVNKLSRYNSPLKVLITYPWVKSTPKCLAQYSDILRRADVWNDFTTHRRHLVIFGYGPEDKIIWKSYVYRLGEFVPIEVTS